MTLLTQARGHTSIPSALTHWASTRPEATAFRFVSPDMTVEDEIGYGELERRTRLAANGLRALAVPGDRVVLLLPPGADYLVAFLGCLRAGIVAVPLYPPRPGAGMDRVERVVADCRARLVLTAGEPTEPGFHAVEEILSGSAEPLRGEPDGDAIAFLQYTSGSTAQPKGVMVSHRNLVANELAIMAGFGLRADDVVVSWLPMYHDMGLIGTTLLPLFCGLESVLLNTFRFIRDPASWLRAVSAFRGTCSGGPNFAYGLLADRHDPREQAGLDLSRWRIAFNGAEPVDRPTMDRFAEAYAPHGFRPEAFLPCYGLAEATLFVAGAEPMTGFHVESFDRDALRAGRLASATEDAVHLVASGRAAEGTTVLVRDNDGGVADDGEIGEICVRAPSVARGYWGDEANTAATFHGRIAGHDGDFLRTGDLGALRDGRLYVVGRSKDLIIVAGRNHYPQDVEAVAVDAAPERLGRTAAAFQWDDGRVGLVVEARRGQARLLAQPEAFAVLDAEVRRQVGAACGIDLAEFVVVRPGGIPRTSSGKVRRARTRELLTEDGLAVLGRADPAVPAVTMSVPTGVREVLRQAVFARTIGLDPADERRPLATLGFDSLRLVTLRGAVEQRLGHRVDGELFFGDMSIESIADAIDKAGPPAAPHETLADETVPPETGPPETASHKTETASHKTETAPDESAPLSEGQAQLYFYDQLYRTDVANNLAHAMRFHARLDPALLHAAVRGVIAAHPALRTAFGPPRARRQTVHADARFDWLVHEVEREDTERIRELLGEFAYRRFDLADGPLVRAAVVVGPETTTLMVVSHHGIVDYWALRIVAAGIAADVLGVGPAFPPPAASPFDWARAEADGVESARGRAGLADLVRKWRPHKDASLLPARPPARRTANPAGTTDFLIDAGAAQALDAWARSRGVTPFVGIAVAYLRALHECTGHEQVVIGTPHHGRDDPRFAGTVGYFVNLLPLLGDFRDRPDRDGLADRVWRELRDALRRADVPLSRLIRALGPASRGDRTPLFQATLTFQQSADDLPLAEGFAAPWSGVRQVMGGVEVEAFDLPPRDAAFALALYGARDRDRLAFRLVWQRDVVDEPLAHRLRDAIRRGVLRFDSEG